VSDCDGVEESLFFPTGLNRRLVELVGVSIAADCDGVDLRITDEFSVFLQKSVNNSDPIIDLAVRYLKVASCNCSPSPQLQMGVPSCQEEWLLVRKST
jgi:hypothetical protein